MPKIAERTHVLTTIGILRCGFADKFGIPRQPGLVDMPASIQLLPPYNQAEAFDGIDSFSHLWIEFLFHENLSRPWTPKVRPPCMGGNEKRGVFATRSPYRPNYLGLSCVKLTGLRRSEAQLWLDIEGADMVDGTPIVDIKPYLPYADAVPQARDDFTGGGPEHRLNVSFTAEAAQGIRQLEARQPRLMHLITQTLAMDPRPAYQQDPERIYGIRLFDLDIKWLVQGDQALVVDIIEGGPNEKL